MLLPLDISLCSSGQPTVASWVLPALAAGPSVQWIGLDIWVPPMWGSWSGGEALVVFTSATVIVAGPQVWLLLQAGPGP